MCLKNPMLFIDEAEGDDFKYPPTSQNQEYYSKNKIWLAEYEELYLPSSMLLFMLIVS